MDSRVGHFRVAVRASDGQQLTEEGSLGEETAQVKTQSFEDDEGTSRVEPRCLSCWG